MATTASNGNDRVRYAVVGLGHIAQVAVLPAFEHASPSSELVALVSHDPRKLDELGDRFGAPVRGSYDEMEDVLARSRADAVYITLPNSMHRELTERAARAGVHVLCEKPMAMNQEECAAMIRATSERNLKLMIAYRLHFEEANLRAIEIARDGTIGDPRIMSSVFSQQVRPGDIRTRAETGGGALFDLGVYCINAARYLFRDEPVEVSAFTVAGDDRFDPGVDQTTAALLRFPGDRLAQIVVSQAAADVSEFRIVGTTGDLRVEPAYGYATDLAHHLTVGGETRTTRFEKRDQFAPELIHFSRCILEDQEPEPSGAEGLADVRVMEAALRSARERRPIELPPFGRSRRPDLGQEMHKPPVEKPETVHASSPHVR